MKASAKLDGFLRARGFGYGKPYYQRLHEHLPVIECVHLAKHPPGILMHIKVVYADRDGGPQISPIELDVLYADGRASGIPSIHEAEAFWAGSRLDEMVDTFAGAGLTHLRRLTDPALMVETYEFLTGSASNSRCLSAFPELLQPWVSRAVTPVRSMSHAAYLNLQGRFEEAKSIIGQIARPSAFDQKILGDAEVGEIRFLEDARKYLRSIGARA
jgi:hypothetical protein